MVIFWKLIKTVIWIVIVLALGLVGVLLAAKYVITPQLEQWRPDLEQWVAKKIQLPFQVDNMAVQWQDLAPQLNLSGVVLGEDNDHQIQVQDLAVELEPASLITLNPKVKSLSLNGLKMFVERSATGEISILNKVLNADKGKLIAQMPQYQEQLQKAVENWLSWAFEQLPTQIHIKDAHVVWRDQRRKNLPDLEFNPVSVSLTHDNQRLSASVQISPPAQAGSTLQLNANFTRDGDGHVQLTWHDWKPNYFKEWFYFPLVMQQGIIKKAEGDFEFKSSTLSRFSVQTALNDFVFMEKEARDNHAFVVQGDAADLAITSDTGLQHPYHFDIKAQKLYVQADDYFRHPMDFTNIHMRGVYELNAEQHTRLKFEQFITQLPHGEVNLSGSWEVDPNSDNGIVDLQGSIPQLALNKLPDYLPKTINADSLDWLENAFLNGTLENASVKVQGVVDHIPFGLRPQSGDFRIQGEVKDLALHYHQYAKEDESYWPDIVVPSAQVDFNRQNIHIKGKQFTLAGALGEGGMQIHEADVQVNNIEKDSYVDIQASLGMSGADLLDFYQTSPLQRILSHSLDKSKITGNLEGSLSVHIPILNADASTVRGEFTVQDASFQLSPDYPMLTQANGSMVVTEQHVVLNQIKGKLLGSDAQLDGEIGARGDSLSIQGIMTDKGLYDYLELSGKKKSRLKGQSAYTVQVDFLGGKNIDVTLQSNLKGLALNLPESLAKKAEQESPLEIHLLAPQAAINPAQSEETVSDKTPYKRAKNADKLMLDYKNLHLLFERNNRSAARFNRGVITLGQVNAIMPVEHLRIEARETSLDIDDWLDIIDEFSPKSSSDSNIFPETKWLNIDADRLSLHGAYIEKVKLQGKREGSEWLLNIDSPDAKGDVNLALKNGVLDKVTLVLDKFTFKKQDTAPMGETSLKKSATEESNVKQKTAKQSLSSHTPTRVDLPSIQGRVKRLFLPDHLLGQLEIDGQQKNKNTWQLNSLSLTNDVGSLYATGELKSSRTQTQGDIKLNINAINTGKFLQYFGYAKDLKAGKGFINAQLNLDDVSSWDLEHLKATGKIQVNNGALLQVNSNSMKVLALVSLQSFAGLSSFAGRSPSVLSKGLPFDYMRSSFTLDQGSLVLHDFRLNGPLVAIVAAGKTHLKDEMLDIEIAAIPKIEMSGAAVLAGVIVNPVVGVGAFLSQWLLTTPLNRALTAYYHVTGTWNEPQIQDKSLPTEHELKESQAGSMEK